MRRGFGIGWRNERAGMFVCYWWFTGWDCISFGLHVCISAPNIEIHLPFGFVRIGRRSQPYMLTEFDIITTERRPGVRG